VRSIIDLLDLKKKFQSFGWYVEKINGHNFRLLDKTLKKLIKIKNKPKIIIADTIKGRGIKKMEHPNVMKKNKKYNWHAGAPDDQNFFDFQMELIKKINYETKKKIKTQLKILNILNTKLKSEVLEIH
jgi:transketolase